MRPLIPLVLVFLIGALIAHAQLEDCSDLPQEGEGFYPAFAPPFNVDTTNGGWSSDPPRFQRLAEDGDELCGSIFTYQDSQGLVCQDVDGFEFLSLTESVWLLRVWTEGDRPLHFRFTNGQGRLHDCGTLFSGFWIALFSWPDFYHLELSLADAAPLGQEIPWRLQLAYAGGWDPIFPDNETPTTAQPIGLPFEEAVSNIAVCDLAPADLDLAHLWRPWQGDFDPTATARAGDTWYRLHLGDDERLSIQFTCGYAGDLLVFHAAEGGLGDLVLGGSTACMSGLGWVELFPAGDYFVAVSGTQAMGMGLLRIEPRPCLPPGNLRIRCLGAGVELSWEAVPAAAHYRLLGGDTPDALAEIAVVTEPRFVDTRALSRTQRWYQVVTICE